MSRGKVKEYDIIVFGASGFTGKYVLAEVARAFIDDPSLKFAVAGRNAAKLQEALIEVQQKHCTGHQSLHTVKKFVANVDNSMSLYTMANQARVLINCVGPYAFYGEQVVKACIKAGCSHIDLSGEQQFLEGMQLKYDIEARLAGVYIIGSCGFDSIPSDLGIVFTERAFEGDLNSVEGYLKFDLDTIQAGSSINYGTFASAINVFRDKTRIYTQNQRLLNKPMPLSNHPLPRKRVFYADDVKSWAHYFPACDKSVVKRTQYHFYHNERKRPIQYNLYACQTSIIRLFFTILGFLIFIALCSFRLTRWLLLLFPDVFSFGYFSRKGPSMEKIKNSSFSLTLVGKGYRTKVYEPDVPHSDIPTDMVITKVSGPEAGYITTPICAVSVALMLLKERDLLPLHGGVFTPAAALSKTSIFEHLAKKGLMFKVVHPQCSTE